MGKCLSEIQRLVGNRKDPPARSAVATALRQVIARYSGVHGVLSRHQRLISRFQRQS